MPHRLPPALLLCVALASRFLTVDPAADAGDDRKRPAFALAAVVEAPAAPVQGPERLDGKAGGGAGPAPAGRPARAAECGAKSLDRSYAPAPDAASCRPHAERLPYHATAPPPHRIDHVGT